MKVKRTQTSLSSSFCPKELLKYLFFCLWCTIGFLFLFAQAKEPKAVIKVDTINASFQPEKIGNPNGLQITYLKDYNTRNIFLYHENSKVSVSVCSCFIEGMFIRNYTRYGTI